MEQLSVICSKILENIVNNYSDEIANVIFVAFIGLIGYVLSAVKNSYLQAALQAVEKGVIIVQQTVVSDLKAKSADGKLSDEDKAEVKAHAVKTAKEQLGLIGNIVLGIVTGSVDKWLNTQVEYIVGRIKLASNSGDSK